ncbi:ribonuclease H-like domain-containing protein [Xylariaceae sp. FL0804]|nr:ribonuclease H-like domain-containing protein [Xylariaceae sp. FL0804]
MDDTPLPDDAGTRLSEEEAAAADLETPATGVFVPPSVHRAETLRGESYMHFSPVPPSLLPPTTTTSSPDNNNDSSSSDAVGVPCVLGIDEAGRGPVLGPMVYGAFYLPAAQSDALLKEAHHFDDSKVLTPAVRSDLMRALCTPSSSSSSSSSPSSSSPSSPSGQQQQQPPTLHSTCGWATYSLSATSIGAGMQRPSLPYNLNAQALDATAALIRGALARGVNVRDVFVDTVGPPAAHQARLARLFPSCRVVVAKKADSLYPCVSAASVCAKVTRDAELDLLYAARVEADGRMGNRKRKRGGTDAEEEEDDDEEEGAKERKKKINGQDKQQGGGEAEPSWGSGYPSDARCVAWLRRNMHPVFGWGPECRFSWGTAKDMLETRGGVRVEWPAADDDDEGTSRLTDFFVGADERDRNADELGTWFGTPAGLEAF